MGFIHRQNELISIFGILDTRGEILTNERRKRLLRYLAGAVLHENVYPAASALQKVLQCICSTTKLRQGYITIPNVLSATGEREKSAIGISLGNSAFENFSHVAVLNEENWLKFTSRYSNFFDEYTVYIPSPFSFAYRLYVLTLFAAMELH